MKYHKLAASTIIALLSSYAYAHPSYKGEVAPSPLMHNWTGYYAGLNLGAVKHTMNITDTNASSFNATIQQDLNPQLTGGFQAGYRHQMDCARTSAVYGLEFSANFSNAQFKKEYGSPFALYQLKSKNSLTNVLLLQLTGGISVDRTLLFLAAGMSWSNITGNTTNEDGAPFFNSFSVARKQFGTALGAGIEYAFTDKISLRFKVDVINANNYTTHDDIDNSFNISNNIVQATIGVNYNFA
jgi:opacity protein-like surface antigen